MRMVSLTARSLMVSAAATTSFISGSMFGKGYGPLHTRSSGYRSISRLNRSHKWKRARSYAEARALSPFPERPVR